MLKNAHVHFLYYEIIYIWLTFRPPSPLQPRPCHPRPPPPPWQGSPAYPSWSSSRGSSQSSCSLTWIKNYILRFPPGIRLIRSNQDCRGNSSSDDIRHIKDLSLNWKKKPTFGQKILSNQKMTVWSQIVQPPLLTPKSSDYHLIKKISSKQYKTL